MDAVSCALLPAFCSLCGSPLPQLSSVPICDSCWAEFSVGDGPVCVRCGDTIDASNLAARESTAGLCRTCRLAPPPFERAVSFGPYQGRLKEAIHALKYDRLHPAARQLGSMLAKAIAQLDGTAPRELLVVPVPLHRTKQGDRGFNQARSLAEHALRALAATHPQWMLTLASRTLIRMRPTQNQAGLTPRMRRQNVRGAFAVSGPADVAGKHVLLVDDILTTGATARAAAKALAQAGAATIWVATLARARRVSEFGREVLFEKEERNSNEPAVDSPVESGFSLHGQSFF